MRVVVCLLSALISYLPVSAMGNESTILSFMPAIIAATTKGSQTQGPCGDIAGCYYGTISDSVSGNSAIKLNLNADCSFSGASAYPLTFKGALTRKSATSVSGSGTVASNSESAKLSLTCNINAGTTKMPKRVPAKATTIS